MAHRTQGNIYICWSVKKEIVEDMNEQPDEETHKARSRRVPSTGVSVPVESGGGAPPSCT